MAVYHGYRTVVLILLCGSSLLVHSSQALEADSSRAQTDTNVDGSQTQDDTDDVEINIDFDEWKLATGDKAQYRCTSDSYANDELLWLNQNDTVITSLNHTRITDNGQGVLTIDDARLQDAGVYTCVSDDGLYNQTVTIEVYEMPDYFFEGMVVLAINLALILLFCICLITSTIKERRETRKYRENTTTKVKQPMLDT